jgi:hypothetical protein
LGFTLWWRQKTRLGKAILVLAALLLLQITLAVSSEYTVFPAYDAYTHTRIEDSERGPFLLVLFQMMMCLPTLALLLIAFVVRAILVWRRPRCVSSIVPPEDPDNHLNL